MAHRDLAIVVVAATATARYSRQWPAAQPIVQESPHVPQFFESVARLASHPFAGAPSQLANPDAQVTTAHAPWTHATVDACGSAQLAPHALQFCGSNVVFVQCPRQFVSPGGHEHAPAAHAIPAGHAPPHRPQFCGSYETLVQMPPQSVCPAGHEPPAWSISPTGDGVGPALAADAVAIGTHTRSARPNRRIQSELQ